MNERMILRSLLAALLLAMALLACPSSVGLPSQDTPAQEKPTGPPSSTGEVIHVPLPQGTRIFLKDGNYLLAREYKIEADRVRYWSVERSAWEEIPEQLVDWDATHKGEAEDVARKKQIDEKLQEIAQHQRAASLDIDTSIEVAPGVYLPDAAGFYVVADGAVTSLSQDLAESRLSKKRLLVQVLSPVPVIPSKHDVDLKGTRAALRVHDPRPEFYFRTADQREPNVALIRAHVHGDSRRITEISTLRVTGESHSKEDQMALERWLVARGTYRYTLGKKLEPGEYAFIENVMDQGIDLYVWDFGVDAAAPVKK
jgi:hypothetical protein